MLSLRKQRQLMITNKTNNQWKPCKAQGDIHATNHGRWNFIVVNAAVKAARFTWEGVLFVINVRVCKKGWISLLFGGALGLHAWHSRSTPVCIITLCV